VCTSRPRAAIRKAAVELAVKLAEEAAERATAALSRKRASELLRKLRKARPLR
jgi:hypothetical protein